MDQAEQEIRDMQQRWMEAASRKDEPVLEDILADEYVLISARLGFVDRNGWLAMGPDYDIEEFEYLESESTFTVTQPSRTRGTGRRRRSTGKT